MKFNKLFGNSKLKNEVKELKKQINKEGTNNEKI